MGITQTTSHLTSFGLLQASSLTSLNPSPATPNSSQPLYTFQSTLLGLCFCLFLCVFHLHRLHHSFRGPRLEKVTRESLPRRAAGCPSSWLLLQALHTDPASSHLFLLPLRNFYLQFFPGPLFCCCYLLLLLLTSFVTHPFHYSVTFLGPFLASGSPLLFWDAVFVPGPWL